MTSPSIDWREQIAADEAARFAGYARELGALQAAQSKKYGVGRALHRKQLFACEAQFEVLGNLPAHARYGLFKQAATYQALIRLSNGSFAKQNDRIPDIRGFAIKVLGIEGPSALGGTTQAQDFLLINREVFGMKNSAEFMGLVLASAKGGLGLISYFLTSFGLFDGMKRLGSIVSSLRKPFTGFATEAFFSAAPLACGPYAVRVRLLPASQEPAVGAAADWGQDMQNRLGKESLSYDFQLQFFVNEKLTPIEDGTVNWAEQDAPYVTVARLRLPKQNFSEAQSQAIAGKVEKAAFDPWCALLEHKPLGDVMRARKDTYFVSQNNRGKV